MHQLMLDQPISLAEKKRLGGHARLRVESGEPAKTERLFGLGKEQSGYALTLVCVVHVEQVDVPGGIP